MNLGKLKIAIIGSGAAGIIASLCAKKPYTEVDLYEKNSRIGKKILASGNGRCNISNTHITKDDYYGEDVSFAEHILKRFGFREFDRFCKEIGLMLGIKEDGRVYPLSDEAKSVVIVFERALKSANVNILTDTAVTDIKKENGKFFLFSNSILLGEYDRVLVSSGLLAAPQLGGSKDGLDFALRFSHSFNKPYPALVPLELNSNLFKLMSGVKHESCVSLYVDKKKVDEVCGDVLFTNYGISGFAVLDISTQASFYLSKDFNVSVSINFFPGFDRQHISKYIERAKKRLKGYTVFDVLCGILPVKIVKAILKDVGIKAEDDISSLSTKTIKAVVNRLFDLRFDVKSTHGFKYAEASGGGIKTNQVNIDTMESKLVKGLYFAGEVLDIVGKRGGYNFAFAFASGYIAGISVAEK